MLVNKSLFLIVPIFLKASAFTVVIPRYGVAFQNSITPTATEISSGNDSHAEVNGMPPTPILLDDQSTTTMEALDTKASKLKHQLLMLAKQLNRGFQASSREREQVKEVILQLAPLNPTAEPAAPYYDGATTKKDDTCTLAGKWTLVYTDAPDITGLDTSRVPFSTAQLGRIGQECSPPFIKNVIEWKRPEWARNLPFSGSDESRVLQKVVTSASASPEKPKIVNLKVAGLEVEAKTSENSTADDVTSRIQKDGLVAGLLSMNPIDLKGPLNPPFGQFEVLYLDDDLRIIKTNQNYFAVNQRIKDGEEWF